MLSFRRCCAVLLCVSLVIIAALDPLLAQAPSAPGQSQETMRGSPAAPADPQAGITPRAAETPVEQGKLHPAPEGAASVNVDPDLDNWGGSFWIWLIFAIAVFAAAAVGGLMMAMRQRRQGGASQEPRRA